MLSDLPRPIVFAHRGASALAPENTITAFELALVQGTDAIELDARLTSDGQVVVFHDPMLERTTDGTGPLAQKSLAEVRVLDAASHFAGKLHGEKIPLLEEVFEAVGRKLFINIELKNFDTPRNELVARVCDLVKKCGLEERVMLSSFMASNLNKARQLLPQVPRALLAPKRWLGSWARSFGFSFGDYAALHPWVADVDLREVQRVHRLGRRIHVWTVNQPETVESLKAWDVDGIFTDDPAMALKALGRQK